MKKTLKDLFIKDKSYITEIELGKDFYLFVECLNEYSESINGTFDINKVGDVLVEIIFKDDVVRNVYDITIYDTIDYLKERAMIEIRQGYQEISGLDNENEFTDQEMLEYMQDELKED